MQWVEYAKLVKPGVHHFLQIFPPELIQGCWSLSSWKFVELKPDPTAGDLLHAFLFPEID